MLLSHTQGHAYRLGDFVMRVGSCRKGAVYRGLALEVRIRAVLLMLIVGYNIPVHDKHQVCEYCVAFMDYRARMRTTFIFFPNRWFWSLKQHFPTSSNDIRQVEYMPCCRVADGLAMIEAFLPSIDEAGGFVSTNDLRDPSTFGTNPQFSVKHTALQITDLFNKVFA